MSNIHPTLSFAGFLPILLSLNTLKTHATRNKWLFPHRERTHPTKHLILWGKSMDWLKGKFTGKPHIQWENLWFPVNFPFNQSIEKTILIIASAASSSRWALAPTPELEHLSAAARPPAGTHPDVICPARSPKKLGGIFNSKNKGFQQTNTGWWLTYPSETYELVSWDDEIPNLFGQ